MITNLLQKSAKKEKSLKKIKKPPVIEVLNQTNNEEETKVENSKEDFDLVEKEHPNEEYLYGFNNNFFDFFKDLQVFYKI